MKNAKSAETKFQNTSEIAQPQSRVLRTSGICQIHAMHLSYHKETAIIKPGSVCANGFGLGIQKKNRTSHTASGENHPFKKIIYQDSKKHQRPRLKKQFAQSYRKRLGKFACFKSVLKITFKDTFEFIYFGEEKWKHKLAGHTMGFQKESLISETYFALFWLCAAPKINDS